MGTTIQSQHKAEPFVIVFAVSLFAGTNSISIREVRYILPAITENKAGGYTYRGVRGIP